MLWPLVLGFGLSGTVQAVVSHKAMVRLLGDDSPRSLGFARLFGIASSSCLYAAVALARSLYVKGGSFAATMVFQLASTNLVIELGIVLVVLMGYQFTAAGYTIEFLFGFLGLIPTSRDVAAFTSGPELNYTSVLNVIVLLLAFAMVWRFIRTGGPRMLARV